MIDQSTDTIFQELITVISETNGVSLLDTLDLMATTERVANNIAMAATIADFRKRIIEFQFGSTDFQSLLDHPIAKALYCFFKRFPLPFHEDHIHLTGSLDADFLYPYVEDLMGGQYRSIYKNQIESIYGKDSFPVRSKEHLSDLLCLKEHEQFSTYLKKLHIPKLVLLSREIHEKAAYHMAKTLWESYNVGRIRLKFTLARQSTLESESIPGIDGVTEEDVVLGLYSGFAAFKKEQPRFDFILSPSFRKEPGFFDNSRFASKKDHFNFQVESLISILERHPFLRDHLNEIDTVGDERQLFRKTHFMEMCHGIRKLQYLGFSVRSHHGEVWNHLRAGIQAVDNAMNIWHIDTLEHGLSLGINPNFYFQRLYQKVMERNGRGERIEANSLEGMELADMAWQSPNVLNKLLQGLAISASEDKELIKTKFHSARELEHYQHDILNRMINKNISLVALPSSNKKLTGFLPEYRDHPFSWWEKKQVKLAVGTDNYVTLDTNYINELLILLFSDPSNLKITKLLMVITGENRRPYLSHLLWDMRKQAKGGLFSESL